MAGDDGRGGPRSLGRWWSRPMPSRCGRPQHQPTAALGPYMEAAERTKRPRTCGRACGRAGGRAGKQVGRVRMDVFRHVQRLGCSDDGIAHPTMAATFELQVLKC